MENKSVVKSVVKSVKLNEKQVAILGVLKGAEKPMTLREVSAVVGFEVKSGTTNSLVKNGYMAIVGERVIVCEVCGHKHKVKEYSLGAKEYVGA